MTIALFTDFGASDLYVGQVKAVLERDAPGVGVIDLLNEAPAYNVRASAHLLASLVPWLPPGTVFLALVDPGVGGARAPLVVQADGYHFVGPDNGLLSVWCARAARAEVFRIAWVPERLTPSFHGRDLFAPIAARLAAGKLCDDALVPLQALTVDFGADDLPEIIYLDHYGNAATGLRVRAVPQQCRLEVGGRILRYARVFGEVAEGEAFWYFNSQGLVEIAVNKGDAAAQLGLVIGDAIRIVP
jgi:S-adenosylmethionine hydrolase